MFIERKRDFDYRSRGMVTIAEQGPSKSNRENEIVSLLERVTRAILASDHVAALRLSDRLYRRAGSEADVAHIHARALINADQPAKALTVLEKAAQTRADRRIVCEIIRLLLHLGRLDAARAQISRALGDFAVAPGDELAELAQQMLSQPGAAEAGWIGRAPDLSVWGELAPGATLDPTSLLIQTPQPSGLTRITLKGDPPAGWVAMARDRVLLGRSGACPADLGLEASFSLEGDKITGFVRLGWGEIDDLAIEVSSDGVAQQVELAAPLPSGYRAFEAAAPSGSGPVTLAARLPNGRRIALPGSPLVRHVAIFEPGLDADAKAPPSEVPDRAPACVAIIVGSVERAQLLDRVGAVLAATAPDVSLLVVTQAEDGPLTRDLHRMAQHRRLYILHSDPAKGWAGAVNCALDVARERDLAILAADMFAPPGWLERLADAAYADGAVGMVSPLLALGEDLSQVEALHRDGLAAQLAPGGPAPFAPPCDACLYIRSDCLAAVGSLDGALFVTAKGAVADFQCRANALGWRSIAATNLFMARTEEDSRQADRDAAILDQRHPAASALARQMDGRRSALRRLDEARLQAMSERFALIITLSLPGGVGRCISERCEEMRRAGLTPLILKPDGLGRAVLHLADDERTFRHLIYEDEEGQGALVSLIAALPVARVELHHFLDHAPGLIERLLALDCGYDVYIHDNVWVCPRIMLLGGDGYYCGEPELAACETCLITHGGSLEPGLTVSALRKRSAGWLAGARRIIAPSHDAADRVARYFPQVSPQVHNWQAPAPVRSPDWSVRKPDQPVKVAIIGAIGPWKGYQLVLDCARDAVARGLGLEFVIIGYTHDDELLMQTGAAFVTGEYEPSELPGLLAREAPDVAFVSSLTPETWSYALSEALQAGLDVAALDIGAVPERLRAHGQPHLLLPLPPSPPAINDALIAFALAARERRDHPQAQQSGEDVQIIPAFVQQSPVKSDLETVSGSMIIKESLNPASQAPTYSKHSLSPVYQYDEQTKRPGEALMPKSSSGLLSSADVLTLDAGLYVFTVKDASPERLGDDRTLVLPAVHVGLGPGVEEGVVNFMSGLRNGAGWLFERNDVLVVRVNRSGSHLMLTSVRRPGMAALKIDVERMDANRSSEPTAPPARLSAPAAPPPGPAPIRTQVNLRIEDRGVTAFMDNGWAGAIGQQLPIDAFSILPLETLPADCVQYKALTANGVETPWTSGGALCGVAGGGAPLIGFAIRLTKGAEAQFDVSYRGAFQGGGLVGPVLNGAACQISSTNALLEAIEVRITRKAPAQQALPGAPPASGREASGPPASGPRASAPAQVATPPRPQPAAPAAAAPPPPAPQPGPVAAPPAPPPARGRAIGPKFSIFRDETP